MKLLPIDEGWEGEDEELESDEWEESVWDGDFFLDYPNRGEWAWDESGRYRNLQVQLDLQVPNPPNGDPICADWVWNIWWMYLPDDGMIGVKL